MFAETSRENGSRKGQTGLAGFLDVCQPRLDYTMIICGDSSSRRRLPILNYFRQFGEVKESDSFVS